MEESGSEPFVPVPMGLLGYNNSQAQDFAHEMAQRLALQRGTGAQKPDSGKEYVLGAWWDSPGRETDDLGNS